MGSYVRSLRLFNDRLDWRDLCQGCGTLPGGILDRHHIGVFRRPLRNPGLGLGTDGFNDERREVLREYFGAFLGIGIILACGNQIPEQGFIDIGLRAQGPLIENGQIELAVLQAILAGGQKPFIGRYHNSAFRLRFPPQ